MQKLAIERAAAARGHMIGTWFSEKKSAKTVDRPELLRLRALARAGGLKRLYLFRLDRLTRSGIRDTLQIVDELRRHGVEILTVSDGFDLAGPAADIVLSVMAWASQMERLAINERIACARDRMEAEGKTWGRPPVLDAALTGRVRELRAAGRSLRSIAKELGISKSTVERAGGSPSGTGIVTGGAG